MGAEARAWRCRPAPCWNSRRFCWRCLQTDATSAITPCSQADTSPTSSAGSGGSELTVAAGPRPKSGKGSRGARPRLFARGACQSDGCAASLSSLPFYNQRNHIWWVLAVAGVALMHDVLGSSTPRVLGCAAAPINCYRDAARLAGGLLSGGVPCLTLPACLPVPPLCSMEHKVADSYLRLGEVVRFCQR